jgi:hypothetical protein
MAKDAVIILGAAALAALYELHAGPLTGAKRFWRGTLIHGRPMWILLALLCGFAVALILTSRKLHLYSPMPLGSILHEQRLSAEACFTSGLLLTCTLYLVHADDIPRRIVLLTIGLVTIFLGLRRLLYRALLYRRFERGVGTRKVLIVGTGPEAHALRHRLERTPHLGYTFKGFIELPGSGSSLAATSGEAVCTLETVFQHARKQFVDEIFFASPCEHGILLNALEQARAHGVDLRAAPEMYHDLAGNSSVEYIGESPTILFQSGQVSEFAPFFKRVIDIVFSSAALIVVSPLLLAIAIAVKLDSPGPVFYSSGRIGKRGRTFRCIKFRTMVPDAEMQRDEIMHLNERDADGYAERDAALLMLAEKQEGRSRRITVGADKAYDTKDFVSTVRELNVTPHVTKNDKGRASNLDRRTTRQPGYAISLSRRWLVEKGFGWLKQTGPLRQVKLRGLEKVDWLFVFSCAAHNLIRLPRLMAQPPDMLREKCA